MAEISISLQTPVSIALNKDPDDLTDDDKQLLREYNERCAEKEKYIADWRAEIEERNMNIQLDVLRQCIQNADDAIILASNDLTEKKYLNFLDEKIDHLIAQKKRDFPREMYRIIDSKIKELRLLYAKIDN